MVDRHGHGISLISSLPPQLLSLAAQVVLFVPQVTIAVEWGLYSSRLVFQLKCAHYATERLGRSLEMDLLHIVYSGWLCTTSEPAFFLQEDIWFIKCLHKRAYIRLLNMDDSYRPVMGLYFTWFFFSLKTLHSQLGMTISNKGGHLLLHMRASLVEPTTELQIYFFGSANTIAMHSVSNYYQFTLCYELHHSLCWYRTNHPPSISMAINILSQV